MKAEVKECDQVGEYWFKEGCHIKEIANDTGDEHLSIARARVEPNTSTSWHKLTGVTERYLIISGHGHVEIGESFSKIVGPGDVVRIPSGIRQRIHNNGEKDLIFYAICAPPFSTECYIEL